MPRGDPSVEALDAELNFYLNFFHYQYNTIFRTHRGLN